MVGVAVYDKETDTSLTRKKPHLSVSSSCLYFDLHTQPQYNYDHMTTGSQNNNIVFRFPMASVHLARGGWFPMQHHRCSPADAARKGGR